MISSLDIPPSSNTVWISKIFIFGILRCLMGVYLESAYKKYSPNTMHGWLNIVAITFRYQNNKISFIANSNEIKMKILEHRHILILTVSIHIKDVSNSYSVFEIQIKSLSNCLNGYLNMHKMMCILMNKIWHQL